MLEFAPLPEVPDTRRNTADDRSNILVVFVGQTECGCLRWLKQGFKHCFVVLNTNDQWVVCDSLKNRIEFSILTLPSSFSLSEFYRHQGYTVFKGHGSTFSKSSSLIPEMLTCVTVVKRIIGIRSFWTFTPWQLFCLLSSKKDQWRLVR